MKEEFAMPHDAADALRKNLDDKYIDFVNKLRQESVDVKKFFLMNSNHNKHWFLE